MDVVDGEMVHIGGAAERVGLSLRTIRHWDEVGLVQPSGRSVGGFRLYTERDIGRLAFVKQLKPLDFRLEEMRDLLETWDRLAAGEGRGEGVRELVEHLEGYAVVAEQRCERLREQLSAAEHIAALLRADVDRARQSGPTS